MFCSNCGKEIADRAAVCVNCGAQVKHSAAEKDGGSGWWWIGFLVPLAGLLIWVTCSDTQPKRAKKAGIGALVSVLVGVGLSVLLVVLWFVLVFVFAMSL